MEDRPPEAPVPPAAPVPPVPPVPPAPPAPPAYAVPPPGGTPPGAPPTIPPPAGPPIPWEEPGRPVLNALWETIKLLYTKPREAFERMPITSDVLRPYLFALIVGWIGIAIGVLWQLSLAGTMRTMFPAAYPGGRMAWPILTGPLTAIFAPVAIAIGVLVVSLILHLCLVILGAGKSGFVATIRVVCYAQAACLLQIVPGCGGLAALVVQIVFMVIGFSAVHRISNGRAAAAVLLPTALCCVCGMAAFGVGMGTYLSHFRELSQP